MKEYVEGRQRKDYLEEMEIKEYLEGKEWKDQLKCGMEVNITRNGENNGYLEKESSQTFLEGQEGVFRNREIKACLEE